MALLYDYYASAKLIASSTITLTKRDTPGSCMVTPTKCLPNFNRQFVMADENELRFFRHTLHQATEATIVRII